MTPYPLTCSAIQVDADAIWKGVTSVSKAGKRRGRGKGAGRRMAKDLNKGQVIGVGPVNMVWPGLNAPILRGREVVSQKRLPQDKSYLINLLKVRNEMDTYKKRKMHPLERGWAGIRMPGKWFGPPSPILDETFEGFESKVLMTRPHFMMKRGIGRSRTVICMVVTGNKNGCAGFHICEAKDARTGLRTARNSAAQRLRFIERDPDGDTLVHDFVSQYRAVKVFAHKKPEGFGIVAHRCLKAICEVAGIRNVYIKTVGPVFNYRDVVKAFFLGLCQVKSWQDMADEKKLHIVELRQDHEYYPRVVASPSDGVVRTPSDIGVDEITDVRLHMNEGKVIHFKPNKYPDYVRTEQFTKALQKYQHVVRNRQKNRVYLKVRYGQLDSFLTVREKEERARRKAELALAAEEQTEKSEAC